MKNPSDNCQICPRLAKYRADNKQKYPDFFNAPVPGFGDENGALAIVGLAPGVKGANRTGRAFTGDYAGALLYSTLLKFDFASGEFKADINDNITLHNCRIINAVRCVPPQNKPETQEIINCNSFLAMELAEMAQLKIILALGRIAHQSVLRLYKIPLSKLPFAHGAIHQINDRHVLLDSYHCSRYNTQTKRLTEQQFCDIFLQAQKLLDNNH